MKYLKTFLVILVSVFITSAAVFAAGDPFERSQKYEQKTTNKISVTTATTTKETVAKMFTHNFDTEYTAQGACLRIKDSDGVGYTFLTVNNGTGNFSTISCE